ncbi:HesB/IscA family protein [Legionella dresdenensis]|uniref:HesB/IscA family protein n=1 Tax=Legionella dresdenensis TaxID=450200 RepID=A0ABV8CC30_9GAMM
MTEVVQHEASKLTGLTLSESAKAHILNYLNQQQQCSGVRFSVKKTGCSGLSYVIDYVHAAEETDIVLPLSQEYKIYIDKKSYPFIKGMTVDYIRQGLNQKFVYTNPNEKGQCGCGESFTV